MKSVIIHRQQRTDRIHAMAQLLAAFPAAQVLEAKVPEWESTPHNIAVRGCTISHLSAVKAFLTHQSPLMVFEDDAVPRPGHDLRLEQLPADAGIVIYGGDVEHYGDADDHGFREVFPKYWGTHAVLYTSALCSTAFLLNALEIAASSCVGQHPHLPGLCLESILLLALNGTGLKMYRPQNMGFTVVQSSGDSGGDSGTRSKALVAQDRDSLLPWTIWEPVFGPWAGRKACLLQQPRNAGDELIRAGTLQLFREFGIIDGPYEEAEVIFFPGGGCLGDIYPFRDYGNRFAQATDVPRVILPHSWNAPDPYDQHADVVWCRDHTSIQIRGGGEFAHDLALAYRPSLNGHHELGHGVFFRDGEEATTVPPDNFTDPAKDCRSHYDYLRLAGSYQSIETNRLHFAVAAMLMGTRVTLTANSYHKNLSVYNASLRELGCLFSSNKP